MKKLFTLLFLVLVLAGCGGNDTTESSQTSVVPDPVIPTAGPGEKVINGRIMDGYIAFATVFLDYNGNFDLDAGEPSTKSARNGEYYLAVPDGDELLYRVVAIVDQYGIDEDDPTKSDGSFNYFEYSFVLTANEGLYANISPISTFITLETLNSVADPIAGINNIWRVSTGSLPVIDWYADYVAYSATPPDGLSSTANEYDMLHKLNRVLVFAYARAFDGAINGVLGTNEQILWNAYSTIWNVTPLTLFNAAFATYTDFVPQDVAVTIGLNDSSLNGM